MRMLSPALPPGYKTKQVDKFQSSSERDSVKMFSFATFCLLLAGAAFAVEEDFSYDRQDIWPGVCVTGNNNMQSPIDIDDADFDGNLMELMMNGWDVGYDGTFFNGGHNVQFDPDMPAEATTETNLGTFEVLQFHMHWGTTTGTGSEHLVSGEAEELEIHFVHRNRNQPDVNASDAFAVVAVLGRVDEDAELTNPWYQLNASAVEGYEEAINITGFRFDQLLPDNLEYYHYMGSLTTPACSEVVAWYVLRNTITVPGAFLEQLRRVEGTDGEVLGFNFRMPQDLNNRPITTNSQRITKPLIPLIMVLSLILIGRFAC